METSSDGLNRRYRTRRYHLMRFHRLVRLKLERFTRLVAAEASPVVSDETAGDFYCADGAVPTERRSAFHV